MLTAPPDKRTLLLLLFLMACTTTVPCEPLTVHVDEHGLDNEDCDCNYPCASIKAALMVTSESPKIIIHGTIDEATTIAGGRRVMFRGDPPVCEQLGTNCIGHETSVWTYSGRGPALTIRDGGTQVVINHLAIYGRDRHQLPPTGGVSVLPSGRPMLIMDSVRISGWSDFGVQAAGGSIRLTNCDVIGNVGGGLMAGGNVQLDVTNNRFGANGSETSIVGAVSLAIPFAPSNRLDDNIFYGGNRAISGIGSAVDCTIPMVLRGNQIPPDETVLGCTTENWLKN